MNMLKYWYYLILIKIMFKKISTSYHLVQVSLKYIKRDGELFIYSIFSLLSSLAILLTFIWIDFFFLWNIEALANATEWSQAANDILVYAYIFIYYLSFSFITFFFNTAIITSVQRRIEGKDNKLWDGLRDAMKHLKEIFIWSMINATITTILKILQNKFWENSVVWKIIFWMIGWLWNILTFFSFPLMIIKGKGPKEAIKESGALFKDTWGERAIIHVWVGLLFMLFYILILLLSIFIIYSWFMITGIVMMILWAIFLMILSSTCDVIIKTILLHYAQHGKLPDDVSHEETILNIAWVK